MLDIEDCIHRWNLLLHIVGRPVELFCSQCNATDQDIWPPGGIADLLSFEHEEITVDAASHNAQTLTIIPVNLSVYQSTAFSAQAFLNNRAAVQPTTIIRAQVTYRGPQGLEAR